MDLVIGNIETGRTLYEAARIPELSFISNAEVIILDGVKYQYKKHYIDYDQGAIVVSVKEVTPVEVG